MTQPTKLGAEPGPRFTNYRAVPWVNRTHAVVALPSAGALVTLRQLPPGKATQRTFAGFGDPYFSRGQARLATLHQEEPADAPAVNLRDARLIAAGSRRLDMLPRLPDTAEEIQNIARAMNADLTQDVFLGRRANEQAVKGLDLVRYRVVAFATHGLSPRDLDGLSQPALALTAPEVAGIEGDGLLTLEEILGLRLNADWVVSDSPLRSGKRQVRLIPALRWGHFLLNLRRRSPADRDTLLLSLRGLRGERSSGQQAPGHHASAASALFDAPLLCSREDLLSRATQDTQ